MIIFTPTVAVSSAGPVKVDGLVAGSEFSKDFLLKNSSEPQYLAYLEIDGHLTATKGLQIEETLNGLPYHKLNEFSLHSKEGTEPKVLKVLGSVNFLAHPSFENVNGVNVDELYETAWLAHHSTVLKGNYHLQSAEFTQNILSTVNFYLSSLRYVNIFV